MPRAGYRKDADHRRVHHVSTYLTSSEREVFVERIKLSGLTKAAYVRAALTGVAPRARPGAVRRELVREVNRIGVNLNQLAKRAHAHNLDAGLVSRLEIALNELEAILPEIVRG